MAAIGAAVGWDATVAEVATSVADTVATADSAVAQCVVAVARYAAVAAVVVAAADIDKQFD